MNNVIIGCLNEKDIHIFLKNHYEPNIDFQEIKLGSFVADIFHNDTVVEIQTSNFSNLRKKLQYYLEKYKVIVVYPISKIKYISWINEGNGDISKPRKSPKNSNIFDSAWELNKISEFLTHNNLQIHLVFLESVEYKLLNGYGKNKKIRSNKYKSTPLKILSTTILKDISNYYEFIPKNINEVFTVKDFSKVIKRNDKRTRQVIYLLEKLNLIKKCGKVKNTYLYKKIY